MDALINTETIIRYRDKQFKKERLLSQIRQCNDKKAKKEILLKQIKQCNGNKGEIKDILNKHYVALLKSYRKGNSQLNRFYNFFFTDHAIEETASWRSCVQLLKAAKFNQQEVAEIENGNHIDYPSILM